VLKPHKQVEGMVEKNSIGVQGNWLEDGGVIGRVVWNGGSSTVEPVKGERQ